MTHSSDLQPPDTVCLVLSDTAGRHDVIPLVPGHTLTIGRAPTNRIVLRDDLCSRNHCEVFRSGEEWIVRDLKSRNGTLLDRQPVVGDAPLTDGDRIRIGGTELLFTANPALAASGGRSDRETHAVGPGEAAAVPEILHRRRQTRFGELARRDAGLRDRIARELATLYRLAVEMGTADDIAGLCGKVLDTLLETTAADIGSILLRGEPRVRTSAEATTNGEAADLTLAAYRGPAGASDPTGSAAVSKLVLDGGEAVLGQDVTEDSRLSERDSLGRIRARSLICAPLRHEGRVVGLIHLYATRPDRPLDLDDLEFTLAVADQLGISAANLRARQRLSENLGRAETENESLRQQLGVESELIGDSPAMQMLRSEIAQVAPTDATVLVRGESGVGKELVARAIHFGSHRRGKPLVCMNCAALTESLLESELFGHEKGSFTGATGRKLGKFEQADGGTLFLDEVGEMSLPIQAKFLRVLEGHAFERVGGSVPIRADVRVVAATNRDLEAAVAAGAFRRDLYFRLHVVVLTVEPLRNRPGDIQRLAEHFHRQFAARAGRRLAGFTQPAMDRLQRHDWPGNVRELQNTIERAVILGQSAVLDASDIKLSRLGGEPTPSVGEGETAFRPLSLEALERDHILATLQQTDWNKSQAAQTLGIERSTLDRKLKRYRVSRPVDQHPFT